MPDFTQDGHPIAHHLGPRGLPMSTVHQQLQMYNSGLTQKQVIDRSTQGSVRTLQRILAKVRNGESLAKQRPGPSKGSQFTIEEEDLEAIYDFVSERSDSYLDEIADQIQNEAARNGRHVELELYQVCRGLQFIGFSRKKLTKHDEKRDESDRAAFWLAFPPYGIRGANRDGVIDVDESAVVQSDCSRNYGYAPYGSDANSVEATKVYKKYTLIMGISMAGVVHALLTDLRGTSTDTFIIYIKQVVSLLRGRWVIMMDNLNVHHDWRVRSIIENAGHYLVFRPKYSPDYGPIESAFKDVKTWLRRHRRSITETNLYDKILEAVGSVGSNGFAGHFRNCGY